MTAVYPIARSRLSGRFGDPEVPEAGINAGHCTTQHYELLEVNYSQNYGGDGYWGNSIYITVFRNHLSAIRAAHPPLNTYMSGVYPYMDNVLGTPGQQLLGYSSSGFSFTQTDFAYEAVTAARQSRR
jgi:hypothetical protein